jgi:hypothetical protein
MMTTNRRHEPQVAAQHTGKSANNEIVARTSAKTTNNRPYNGRQNNDRYLERLCVVGDAVGRLRQTLIALGHVALLELTHRAREDRLRLLRVHQIVQLPTREKK